MTHVSRVARRYAAALFQTARRQNVADGVLADLQSMAEILRQYPQVLQALAVPRVPPERKKAALQAVVGARMEQPLTRRFLDVMVDHGREGSLPETALAYAMLSDEARNIVNAEVRTAIPLDDGQTTRLKAKLDRLTGKNVRLQIAVDHNLMGGLVVRIGDTILDGSVRGYLEQVENRLRETTLTAIPLGEIPTPPAA